MKNVRRALVLAPFALGGCAPLPQTCLPPARPMLAAELFFGRGDGGRVVSEGEFAGFLATEITPRFPEGLTVLDGRGQWRDGERGTIVREASKLVKIIFGEDAQRRADLDAIAAHYKAKFHQQSVLVALQQVCATF